MNLDKKDLGVIYNSLINFQNLRKNKPGALKDIFSENARLILTPNDNCNNACYHCIADSTPKGEALPYSRFIQIPEEFFQIFKAADFGRRGDPLLYQSEGKDLADIISYLHYQGIPVFTIAPAIQRNETEVISKLEKLSQSVPIESMLTYHHYFKNLDTDQLANDFNKSLKYLSRFSKKIKISLLGHKFSQEDKSKEVQETFNKNRKIILDGIDESKLKISRMDTMVFPLGRFKKYLEQRSFLAQYSKEFEERLGDYVCPDMIKWPGIIIEPNGDLNTCASFEAITCPHAIISNIHNKNFKEELMQFHGKEMQWFVDNLKEIIEGKVSTCKIKNKCYSL